MDTYITHIITSFKCFILVHIYDMNTDTNINMCQSDLKKGLSKHALPQWGQPVAIYRLVLLNFGLFW